LLLTLALTGSADLSGLRAATLPAVKGEHGMAVTVEPHATRAAVEVLRRGGNAVDAAIAAAFLLSVTYPSAGSLGGGGFLLYRSAEGTYFALDFRETAPAALRPEMFLDQKGQLVPERSTSGGLAVGVPGLVAGLAEAHRRWGTVPWRELVAPAAETADNGIVVSSWNATTLESRERELLASPETRSIFGSDGRILGAGDLLVQPRLATTLRRVASEGAAGFYGGPIAEAIVRTVRSTGGVMVVEDLASYRPAAREPVRGSYRGHGIVSFPPPSSGGVVLLEILGMLERFDLRASGFGSSLTIHRMAEAERRAYADRARWLGDPDFNAFAWQVLLDRDYLTSRALTIRDRRATPSRKVRPGQPVTDHGETTHLSIADSAGGAVAMTVTSNQWFGAALVAEGTGVLLNNEMDDFAIARDAPNLWGLVGGEANAPRGGKRPLSSMTPTIVEPPGGGRPLLVLGSPGGAVIITAVLQVVVNVIDHDMPLQEAVDAARFHHQWLPDRIDHEPWAFPKDVARELEAKGHVLFETGYLGDVSALGWGDDGAWEGAADPPRQGVAAGV
jgi:gamma-glutamyltranspeptidase/glutathione hydrolase